MDQRTIRKTGQLFLDLFARPKPKKAVQHGIHPDAELTRQSADLLESSGWPTLAKKVRVVWNSRLTTTAGLARYRDNLVILNPRLQEFGVDEVDRTLRHELAHLLAHARAGRRRISPHGDEWREACGDLGLTDEKRCHDLPLPRRTLARKHVYACLRCNSFYSRVRPIRKKVACLKCCRKHNGGHFSKDFLLVKVPDSVQSTK